MGRIRTDFVKGMSKKLVAALPDRFSGDFAKNKAALADLKITEEKFTQNKIAGYIVRVVKKKKF